MAFHWQDGWFFERLADGTVNIYHEYIRIAEVRILASVEKAAGLSAVGKSKRDVNINIDPDSWCSIIASVSKSGETADKWKGSLKFHNDPQ